MANCGCLVRFTQDNLRTTREIQYCPLHQAAPEMLDALKIALNTADSWHEFHTASDIVCDDLCAIRPQLRAAVVKVEGASNERTTPTESAQHQPFNPKGGQS